MKRFLAGASLLALSVGLAACNNGGGGGGSSPPAPAAKFEDQFGAAFGVAYRADANSEPKDVAPGDVIPASLTAEPVAFQGA